jgi:hypothetical protein
MSQQTQEGGVVKIAVLLTGIVGNAVATKLVKIGHPHFNLRLALRIALRKAWAEVDSNH